MRVLVTGHRGYIGTVLTPLLAARGHEVRGLDSGLFERCALAELPAVPAIARDLRDVVASDLAGCEAVILGCTEHPLLMNDGNSPLPTLDSTRLLARAALRVTVNSAETPA